MGSGERRVLRRREALALGAAGAVGALAGCSEDGGSGGNGSGDDGGDSDGPREVIVGTAAAFPPFEETTGESITGFDVDLLEAVLDPVDGYTLAGWRDQRFADLPTALVEEDVDVVAAALSVTDGRSEEFAFAGPYFETQQAVLVAEDGPTPGSLEDLEGRTLGSQTGTTGEALIETRLIGGELISPSDYASYDTYPLAVDGLVEGVVDAVVVDVPTAWSFAETEPISVAFAVESPERYGFGVRADDEELRDALDAGLQAVRDDGRYDDIAAEWLSDEEGGAASDGETDNETESGNETASDGGNETENST